MLDKGPKSITPYNLEGSHDNKSKQGGNTGENKDRGEPVSPTSGTKSQHGKAERPVRSSPPCSHPPCISKGLRQWIRYCTDATKEQKSKHLEGIEASKVRDVPSRSTRSQIIVIISASSDSAKWKPTAGRITNPQGGKQELDKQDTASCTATVSNGHASIIAMRRCYDGSDDILVSPTLSEEAALNFIGKISKIDPVHIQVALKNGKDAQSFSVSRTFISPRTVLKLSSVQLAFYNVIFLVFYDSLSCEDFIIGLPVLWHLQVDTRTLL